MGAEAVRTGAGAVGTGVGAVRARAAEAPAAGAEIHAAVEAPPSAAPNRGRPWDLTHGARHHGDRREHERRRGDRRAPTAGAAASTATPRSGAAALPHEAASGFTVHLARRLLAEGFGTFALVFAAAGADTIAAYTGGAVNDVARAVAPALMVGALIYAIADASGAHFNPIVTLSLTLKGLFPARWLPGYWGAQLIGAITAAGVLRLLFGPVSESGVSTPHVDAGTAVAIEAILTALLVSVVLGTADRAKLVGPNAAMAVGATIALCGLIALPLEGASMNPARSLGPAIVSGRLGDAWIYVVGPALGAIAATGLMHLLHGSPDGVKQREAARGEH
jgi:aquaporin Z